MDLDFWYIIGFLIQDILSFTSNNNVLGGNFICRFWLPSDGYFSGMRENSDQYESGCYFESLLSITISQYCFTYLLREYSSVGFSWKYWFWNEPNVSLVYELYGYKCWLELSDSIFRIFEGLVCSSCMLKHGISFVRKFG